MFIVEDFAFKSSAVGESIYSCDWFDSSEGFKRSMRIVMSRSNDPVVFQAWGFVPLSMETFNDVMNTAYSNFLTLKTFGLKKMKG